MEALPMKVVRVQGISLKTVTTQDALNHILAIEFSQGVSIGSPADYFQSEITRISKRLSELMEPGAVDEDGEPASQNRLQNLVGVRAYQQAYLAVVT
ncbi:MAG: hypothetical protein KC877_04730 [Candidatus Kaiserbacteria bacterium]|nr:hypothetical protein [Candidatus Kaiserbacteria bacterium]MCB9816592.1 hypothetical protein [Candidatus Nomurabacteria bacterium]